MADDDDDDYDVWLETWEPGPRAVHASLPHNVADPVARMRMIEDSTGAAALERSAYSPGHKKMEVEEEGLRHFEFFEENQERWAEEFEDYLRARDVSETKIRIFQKSFAEDWVDGASRRQDSPEMMAIKASIRDFDRLHHRRVNDQWVIHPVDESATALFTPEEMASVFDANSGLIASFLPDYADKFEYLGASVPSDLHVRRGVFMPKIYSVRTELHYLSSYSLALSPVEQFAQTWTSKTRGNGIASVFSAPLPAIQQRVVAFAPFIKGMDLSQLELVVAPPIERTPLDDHGEHGGIREFSFK